MSGIEELRQQYATGPLDREGRAFTAGTLADFLDGRKFALEWKWNADRPKMRGICIDDGMEIDGPGQIVVPISGAGVGEDPRQLAEILALAKVEKLKPHKGCGKAGLVLREIRQKLGGLPPTAEEVDAYAQVGVEELGLELGIPVGRVLGFDERQTRLVRPHDLHPGDGAVIGLSGWFLHNLLPREEKGKTPLQFQLAGHYWQERHLDELAVKEMLLALRIASSDHGVGIVERGFRFTALVSDADPRRQTLLIGARLIWDRFRARVRQLQDKGEVLNVPTLDIVVVRVADHVSQGGISMLVREVGFEKLHSFTM